MSLPQIVRDINIMICQAAQTRLNNSALYQAEAERILNRWAVYSNTSDTANEIKYYINSIKVVDMNSLQKKHIAVIFVYQLILKQKILCTALICEQRKPF